jgi:hypothetical protein
MRCTFACCVVWGLTPAPCQTQTPTPTPAPTQTNDDPVAHFGTTVVISSGLRGDIYFLPEMSLKLPKFEKLKPVGTIYADELNVPRRSFTQGFPGVTDRFEWFAIDYRGEFWVEKPGRYTWAVLSDDGSKLYIDGHLVIDNDGLHSAKGLAAFVRLKRGEHRIRLSYFQGPRDEVALILAVIPPGEDEFSLFNTEDYLSPKALAEWKKSKPDDPQFSLNPRPRRKPAQDFEMAPSIPVHE